MIFNAPRQSSSGKCAKKLICGSIGSCEMAKGGAKDFLVNCMWIQGGMERGDDLKGSLLNRRKKNKMAQVPVKAPLWESLPLAPHNKSLYWIVVGL